jgi:hypothetical protein
MESKGWSETSVRNSHSTLRKIAEEDISHLHGEGSLKIMLLEINKIGTEKLQLNTADVTSCEFIRLVATDYLLTQMAHTTHRFT